MDILGQEGLSALNSNLGMGAHVQSSRYQVFFSAPTHPGNKANIQNAICDDVVVFRILDVYLFAGLLLSQSFCIQYGTQ